MVLTPGLRPTDFSEAASIVANMIEAYLDACPSRDPATEVNHEDDVDVPVAECQLEDYVPAPAEEGLCLHSAVDAGAGIAPPGEHQPPICAERQSPGAGLGREPDSSLGSGSRPVGIAEPQAGRLPDITGRCVARGSGSGGGTGSLASGPVQHGLAPPHRTLFTHRHIAAGRRRLLRSGRFQRRTPLRAQGNDVGRGTALPPGTTPGGGNGTRPSGASCDSPCLSG